MQKHVNLVDLVKSFPTNIYLQNLASIQKRTSPVKFAHLAKKSGEGSISSLSTKVEKTIPQWFPEHYEYLKEMLAETHAGAHKGHKPGQEGQSYAEIRAERDKIKQAAMERNAAVFFLIPS